MDDGQHALHQIEVHAADVRHAAEFLADQRFFGRTIHLHDADRGAQVAADGLGARQAHGRDGSRRCGATGLVVVVAVAVCVGVMLMIVPVFVGVIMLVAMVMAACMCGSMLMFVPRFRL